MKEKILNKKTIIICIVVLLIIIGLIIGIVLSHKKTDNSKKQEEQIVEKNSLDTDEINVNEESEETKEETKEEEPSPAKNLKTLADYDGYWFNINDLKDYVAIRDIKDKSLTFDLFLYRLYSMENVKVTLNKDNQGKFKFSDSGDVIEGTISINNQEINLSITKSNFEYIEKGTKYKFNVQMKQKAFEEHMMKITEAENNN